MSEFGRFFGLAPSNDRGKGQGNNRASIASSESDSASTVRVVGNQADATSPRELMPPPPLPIPIPSPHRQASSRPLSPTEESDPSASILFTRPAPPQRTRSGVGLFKVPSYLSLRSNSNSSTAGGKQTKAGSGKGGGSADSSRAPTPMPGPGSQETAASMSWLDFGRRGNMRDVSIGAGSTESAGSGNNPDGTSSSPSILLSPLPLPSPHTASASSLSSNAVSSSSSSTTSAALLAAAAARNKKWANTFVPMEADENSLFMPKSSSDSFSWHRPSLLQVVESLQVALMSKEMMAVPAFSAGASQYPATSLSSSPVSLSRRRSSTNKAPQPIMPTGQSDAIPGRYHGHISYLLEGVRMLQEQLDQAELRATEAERVHQEALDQFCKLSDEWMAREKQLTQDLQKLQGRAGEAAKSKKTGFMLGDETMPKKGSAGGGFAPAPGDLSVRVKEAIRKSETALHKEDNNTDSGKRTTLPALISDWEHDKAISDQYLKTQAATERKQRAQAKRGPKLDPLLAASNSEISMVQQAIIENLQQSIQHNAEDKDHGEKAPPKGKKTRKRRVRSSTRAGGGNISNASLDGPVSDASPPPASRSRPYSTTAAVDGSGEAGESDASSSSSSSDAEEYPGTYVSQGAMLPGPASPAGDNRSLFDRVQDVQDTTSDGTSPSGSGQ